MTRSVQHILGNMSDRKSILYSRRIFFASVFYLVTSAAQAEYKLYPGDTLDFSITSIQDSKQSITVNTDGKIYLPVIGEIRAAGLTTGELISNVKSGLSSKILQRRAPDGTSYALVIDPSDIILNIKEYRAVYLQGNIHRPGEQPYRPGMTVRQAIANSGGYAEIAFQDTTQNFQAQGAQIDGELRSVAAEIAGCMTAIWRLKIQLGISKTDVKPNLDGLRLGESEKKGLFEVETAIMNSQKASAQREKAYYSTVISQADKRLELLQQQVKSEEEGSKNDQADFERLSGLLERGTTNQLRVTDARRTMLLSSTRVLQTSAAASQTAREKEEYKKLLSNYDDKQAMDWNSELQKNEVKLASLQAKLRGLEQQSNIYSNRISNSQGNLSKSARVTIYRSTWDGKSSLAGGLETELTPGDVIEVQLPETDKIN